MLSISCSGFKAVRSHLMRSRGFSSRANPRALKPSFRLQVLGSVLIFLHATSGAATPGAPTDASQATLLQFKAMTLDELLDQRVVAGPIIQEYGAGAAVGTRTAPADATLFSFRAMTLDELLDQLVVATPRTEEYAPGAAASVQAITAEDIQRAGAVTLPEALRLASNLRVARVSSSSWAISARGFNSTLANKLLVKVDGRTVITPLYGSVFWDAQNVLLEDIDRIEIVSGPGGALQGANAVNGVINVISKSAKETQGTYFSGAAGSFLRDFGALRHGGSIKSNLYYRIYGQHFGYNNTWMPDQTRAADRWDMSQGGMRVDWEVSDVNRLTVQGDLYGGNELGSAMATPLDGQNVLGRWTRVLGPESDLRIQAYFDRAWRGARHAYAEDLKTYDVDVQRRLPLGEAHRITWGAGYRLMRDHIGNTDLAGPPAPDRNLQLLSGFIQDEITLAPDRWKLTLGTKLEHNDYSGLELQPGTRLAWIPNGRQMAWTAVSRAVRSPSRADTDLFLSAQPPEPGAPNRAGGPAFDSEKLHALELGYRVRPSRPLWISVASFYNFYNDLRNLRSPATNNFAFGDQFSGETWGVETWAEYAPEEVWRLRGGYTYLNKRLRPRGGPNASVSLGAGNDPEHQFVFHSMLDLPAHFQLDVTGRFVHSLPSPRVPGYFGLDARLAWRFERIEISVVGQSLAESRHREFGAHEIPRSVYGKIKWRF